MRSTVSWSVLLLTGGLLVIVAAVRAPLLPIPLERDEGEYAYIAWRLDYKELPYRDWIDHPTHDQLMTDQITSAVQKQGEGDLRALLHSADSWQIS